VTIPYNGESLEGIKLMLIPSIHSAHARVCDCVCNCVCVCAHIKNRSTVKYLNSNLSATLSGNNFRSRDVEKHLASSPTRGPHRCASHWRLHEAAPTTATARQCNAHDCKCLPLVRQKARVTATAQMCTLSQNGYGAKRIHPNA